MTLETRNILVGSFVVIVGALFLIYSSRGGVADVAGGYQLNAIYQSVDGVSIGTDVLLTGIKVGEVTNLAYVPDGHRASLTMRIDDNIKLPIDSVAMIISSGMPVEHIKLVFGELTISRTAIISSLCRMLLFSRNYWRRSYSMRKPDE